MRAIDVYQTYLAIKRHFSDNTYDYFKYGGKISVDKINFATNNLVMTVCIQGGSSSTIKNKVRLVS